MIATVTHMFVKAFEGSSGFPSGAKATVEPQAYSTASTHVTQPAQRSDSLMAKIVNSWNDFDPLKHVIVGRA